MNRSLPILFVGDAARAEFREAARWHVERGARAASDSSAAMAMVRDGLAPAVIVVAQLWPGQIAAAEIQRLRRAAPLARIVTLLGGWLEGETRSGKPWQAAQRVYWHQWRRLERKSSWSLPVTAAAEDRLLADVDDTAVATWPSRRTIGICAAHAETAESLADALRQHGWTTIWMPDGDLRQPGQLDALVVDLPRGGAVAGDKLRRCASAVRGIPLMAIIGYPRADEAEMLRAAGARAVLSKPFLIDDLVWEIDCVVGS